MLVKLSFILFFSFLSLLLVFYITEQKTSILLVYLNNATSRIPKFYRLPKIKTFINTGAINPE
uniref:Uncharacterized protein n=1 Tax=Virgibacillus oceani TaxID=1479511 RepID=A0A917HQF3_9BACI|nr:hypothetical protein GCM10011398_35970 [Virgibacillus oceani]